VTSLEDQHRFTVEPKEDVDDMSLVLKCTHCGAEIVCGGLATLADIDLAADEHAEVCR
jgi:hypothetical protein